MVQFGHCFGVFIARCRNDRCFPGWINRRLPATTIEDFNRCRLCEVEVRQTSRHIAEVHLMISLHQCPLCEYGAAESRLVRRHMKNNHKKKEIKVKRRYWDWLTVPIAGTRADCKRCGATLGVLRASRPVLPGTTEAPVQHHDLRRRSSCKVQNLRHDDQQKTTAAASVGKASEETYVQVRIS